MAQGRITKRSVDALKSGERDSYLSPNGSSLRWGAKTASTAIRKSIFRCPRPWPRCNRPCARLAPRVWRTIWNCASIAPPKRRRHAPRYDAHPTGALHARGGSPRPYNRRGRRRRERRRPHRHRRRSRRWWHLHARRQIDFYKYFINKVLGFSLR